MIHTFGSGWTDDKLEVMNRYFAAYAQALKNKPFARIYIDAFAGTGERADSRTPAYGQSGLFGDDTSDIGAIKDGSARIALAIDPPFGRYVFIDQSRRHADALRSLEREFPARHISVYEDDANNVLCKLARRIDWRATRAAVFIDPYGLQVNWRTLEALAKTEAVDIALLFPTGPLTRMLTRDGKIPPEWERRIDDHLGPCDWRRFFYTGSIAGNLFSDECLGIEKTIDSRGLRTFVAERLRTIFPYVCEDQLQLENSKGAILYHLFIICANPSEAAIRLSKRLAPSALNLRHRRKR
jgi:three-Cys-motif partner protein